MMGRVLGQHPSIYTFDELHFFEQAFDPTTSQIQLGTNDPVDWAAWLYAVAIDGYYAPRDLNRYRDHAQALIDSMPGPAADPYAVYEAFMLQAPAVVHRHQTNPTKTTLSQHAQSPDASSEGGCDQTPRNLYFLQTLLERFPAAHAVVMVRDPRDVLLSQKKRWQRRKHGSTVPRKNAWRTWAQYHPWTMSRLWLTAWQATDRLAGHGRVHIVRFEDVLNAPQQTLEHLCQSLGISFDPTMLKVPVIGSSSQSDDPGKVGFDGSAVGRFKTGLTAAEIDACQQACGAAMAKMGYELVATHPSAMAKAGLAAQLIYKTPLAVALNAGRMGRLIPALKRRLLPTSQTSCQSPSK